MPSDTKPEGLIAAAESGDRIRFLKALRQQLAKDLVACDGHGSAALARELRATVQELSSLGAEVVEDEVDRARKAREARRAKAANGEGPL